MPWAWLTARGSRRFVSLRPARLLQLLEPLPQRLEGLELPLEQLRCGLLSGSSRLSAALCRCPTVLTSARVPSVFMRGSGKP